MKAGNAATLAARESPGQTVAHSNPKTLEQPFQLQHQPAKVKLNGEET
jgi:hypothetical protein